MRLSGVFRKINDYLSLVKFSHTVFAMPFALLGFFLAVRLTEYEFTWDILVLVILCMAFARNAAMGFNRYIDHEIDASNPRTAAREIPSGLIRPHSALVFVIVNSALFVAVTGLINTLTLLLSPVALLIILGYSLTKHFTALCHLILGLGLSLAPLGAWLSVTASFDFIPVVFSLIVMLWVSGFDIIYALQDTEFDRKKDLQSIPAVAGNRKALLMSRILHTICVFMVLLAGYVTQAGMVYYAGAVSFTGLLIFQHSLVSPRKLKNIGIAFGTTNGIASIVFATTAIIDLYL